MKRTISLSLGLLAVALLPALAQTPVAIKGPIGKVHGHVTNPTGLATTAGSVSLSTDNGNTSKFTFPLNAAGDFTGEASPGTYTILFRAPETPLNKMVDSIDNVKIVANEDTLQDIDMSRKAFIDAMPADQKKALEELKKRNAATIQINAVINGINADLKVALQDFQDAGNARTLATTQLGAGATHEAISAKEEEIKATKFGEVETLMLKDSVAKPDASVLWLDLGQAQVGLKKFDDAETTLKKALEVDVAAKKPNLATQGAINAALGEAYARTGKVPEAAAAYDAAAKADPTRASLYLRNEAVIYSQIGNADAQVATADEAIKLDPTQALPYYLKGQGLIGKATIDASGHYVLPAGCAEAYQKYLELAPTGPYAAEVKGIMAQSAQTVDTAYKAPKATKKK